MTTADRRRIRENEIRKKGFCVRHPNIKLAATSTWYCERCLEKMRAAEARRYLSDRPQEPAPWNVLKSLEMAKRGGWV